MFLYVVHGELPEMPPASPPHPAPPPGPSIPAFGQGVLRDGPRRRDVVYEVVRQQITQTKPHKSITLQ